MALYTYNDYLRDLLKDVPCILAYDTAADYLERQYKSSYGKDLCMSASEY